MSVVALLILAFAVVPAFVFAAIGWLALASQSDDFKILGRSDGMRFQKS